jgi:hypothetical protein
VGLRCDLQAVGYNATQAPIRHDIDIRVNVRGDIASVGW